MRIEVLLIGDELLDGGLDPYPAEILKSMRGKGASVARLTVLPDVQGEIVNELRSACDRGTDLLLVTGGLGPTIDDLTRHALAAFLGKELVVDQEAERWMEGAVLARHGKRPRPSSAALLMAMVPEGTEALRNPVGVACGIRAARGRTTVMCVPGFPDEMRAMFEAYFLPMVMGDGSYERVLRVKRSETSMEPAFQAIAAEFGVRVASLPKRDWRLNGNVVVIKGDEGKVEAAAKKFLEMTASSAEE